MHGLLSRMTALLAHQVSFNILIVLSQTLLSETTQLICLSFLFHRVFFADLGSGLEDLVGVLEAEAGGQTLHPMITLVRRPRSLVISLEQLGRLGPN